MTSLVIKGIQICYDEGRMFRKDLDFRVDNVGDHYGKADLEQLIFGLNQGMNVVVFSVDTISS